MDTSWACRGEGSRELRRDSVSMGWARWDMPTDVFKMEQSIPGAGVPTGITGLNSIFFYI